MHAFATYPFKIGENGENWTIEIAGDPHITSVTSGFLKLHYNKDFELERDLEKDLTRLKLIYPFFWKGDLIKIECYYKNGLPKAGSTLNCNHDFVRYEGFTDIFEYCTKCDKKRHANE